MSFRPSGAGEGRPPNFTFPSRERGGCLDGRGAAQTEHRPENRNLGVNQESREVSAPSSVIPGTARRGVLGSAGPGPATGLIGILGDRTLMAMAIDVPGTAEIDEALT